jgi:hypothetical protein
MRTSNLKKEQAHQGYDALREGQIRISIITNTTDTNNAPLVQTIDIMNIITRYTH